MKSVVLLLLALVWIGSGCNQQSAQRPAATNSAAASTTTAPQDAPAGYLNALVKGQQSAVKTVDTTSLNKALDLFNVDQGRYPKDLNELVQKKYIPQIPTPPFGMKLVYDANAGTVKVVKE